MIEDKSQQRFQEPAPVFIRRDDAEMSAVEALLDPDKIKALVGSGRTPVFVYPTSGVRRWVVFCFVPPEGTRPEDVFRRTQTGIREFSSPNGELRGPTMMHMLKLKEAEIIRGHIRVAGGIPRDL